MHIIEDKERESQQTIKKELQDAKNPYVVFDGSLRSLVLLHLVRSIRQISVLYIDKNIELEKMVQYIEKMRKLWKLRLTKENIDLEHIIKKHGIDKLFSSDDTKIELYDIIYPVKNFNDDDIWNYIKKHNLSYCSIYDEQYINDYEKEEDIKKRFKELGYL